MAFKIRPAEAADVPAMASAHYSAMTPLNDFYAALFEMDLLKAFQAAVGAALQNAATTILVAEHPDSGVVGFIRYQIEDASEGQQGEGQQNVGTLQQATPAAPSPWARKPHLEEIWQGLQSRTDEMDACEQQALQGRRYISIRHLMIHSDWQRQGLGTKLLREVIARSEAEGVPCWITSSAESQELYAKLGFKELGVWTIDDGYWAKRLVEHEKGLGITGNEHLAEQYAGVTETEKCLIRLPSESK
ncbi:hypothetical protein HJFPF1_07748 [Paramyrothecium foliicola]|nr:hypothetical protein HJFPF1_07748 [Paramyrothecium foliicola]